MLPLYLRPLRWLALVGLVAACAPTYQLGPEARAAPAACSPKAASRPRLLADSVEVRLSFVCFEPTRVVFEAEYRNPTRHTAGRRPHRVSATSPAGSRCPAPGQKKPTAPKPGRVPK